MRSADPTLVPPNFWTITAIVGGSISGRGPPRAGFSRSQVALPSRQVEQEPPQDGAWDRDPLSPVLLESLEAADHDQAGDPCRHRDLGGVVAEHDREQRQ